MKTFSLKTRPILAAIAFLYLNALPQVSAQASWRFVPPMPTARWVLTAAAGLDGTVYAIGGYDDRTWLNTVEAYDAGTMTWTRIVPMPTPRADLAAAVGNDGRIFVFGGSNGRGALNVVEAYDPSTDTWATAAPMPTPRGGLAAVTGSDGTIYVIGGSQGGEDGKLIVSAVEAYDPSTDTWASAAPLPAPRSHLAAGSGRTGASTRSEGEIRCATISSMT